MTPPLERAQWLARMICPHEPALRRWLGRRTLIGLDIDDIVQEAYARLAVLPDVDHIHNPRAYFFRTAFTILVNEVRRAQIVPIDAVAQLDRLEVRSMAPTPDMEAEGRQELRLLAEAIAQCRRVAARSSSLARCTACPSVKPPRNWAWRKARWRSISPPVCAILPPFWARIAGDWRK
jgi:DNA-directed RNA polymerase specialized sigma24 family protein